MICLSCWDIWRLSAENRIKSQDEIAQFIYRRHLLKAGAFCASGIQEDRRYTLFFEGKGDVK